MKYIILILSSLITIWGHAQNVYDINLSKTLNENRMGVWKKGDFAIYVELDALEESFRQAGISYLNAFLKKNVDGSVDTDYEPTSKRYLAAANQLKNAENGFDLKKLILYFGKENKESNAAISHLVENTIKHWTENGNAAIFYKGKRIFSLKRLYEGEGTGLDYGYNVVIYYENKTNPIFKYHQHVGW